MPGMQPNATVYVLKCEDAILTRKFEKWIPQNVQEAQKSVYDYSLFYFIV